MLLNSEASPLLFPPEMHCREAFLFNLLFCCFLRLICLLNFRLYHVTIVADATRNARQVMCLHRKRYG